MKYPSSRVSSVGIFLTASVLLILYLFSVRFHVSLPVPVFWISIGLILGIIVYQSLRSDLSPGYVKVVLLEIAVTCLVFHLIYQIPYYGLRGSDVYSDMASVKSILSSGFVMGDPQYIVGTGYFPLIHIFGAQVSLISNTELLFVVKWLPSLLGVATILLIYLWIRSIFKEEKIALLSALLFASLQPQILLSSLFVRETIALVLAVGCIYFYFSARSSTYPMAYSALSIMCLIGTVYAHHLTSFMLLMFLLIHFLMGKASELPFLRRTYLGSNIAGEKITSSFLAIAFVAPFAYWMSVATGPMTTLVRFAQELFAPSRWGVGTYGVVAGISTTSIHTIRGYIVFYGFYSFLLIFGIILLYELLPRLRYGRIEVLSFTLFLFLCGVGGLIELYVIPHGIAPYPHRFLLFGWLFGFPPLLVAILGWRYKWLRGVGIFFLIAFVFLNILMIEPTAWDAKAVGVPSATSEEDYVLANSLDFSAGEIAANSYTRYAIYDVHNNLGEAATGNIDLSEFDWVIVQKEALRLALWYSQYYAEPKTEAINQMEQLEEETSPDRNKIYESNNLSIFKLNELNYD